MTLLGQTEGANYQSGASYIDIAEFIMQQGAHPNADLEELWKRIVFYNSVSNTDDHLRNHGFLLTDHGWVLSPAYDINPVETGMGLSFLKQMKRLIKRECSASLCLIPNYYLYCSP